MKGERLVNLILEYKEEFLYTSKHRKNTSTGNKHLHQTVIDLLEREDQDMAEIGLYAAVYNTWYHKPLEGVIYCLSVDFDTKQEILEAFEEIC